jgi:hypothetical protein
MTVDGGCVWFSQVFGLKIPWGQPRQGSNPGPGMTSFHRLLLRPLSDPATVSCFDHDLDSRAGRWSQAPPAAAGGAAAHHYSPRTEEAYVAWVRR